MHHKSLSTAHCAICQKTLRAGEEFAVIISAGFFAHGFMSGQNDSVIKHYLCSSKCRDMHVGKFWRCHFTPEE